MVELPGANVLLVPTLLNARKVLRMLAWQPIVPIVLDREAELELVHPDIGLADNLEPAVRRAGRPCRYEGHEVRVAEDGAVPRGVERLTRVEHAGGTTEEFAAEASRMFAAQEMVPMFLMVKRNSSSPEGCCA